MNDPEEHFDLQMLGDPLKRVPLRGPVTWTPKGPRSSRPPVNEVPATNVVDIEWNTNGEPKMTTINTSDDLLRLLEHDPQFYQAARRLILTNELLELPTRFNAFVDRVDQFIGKQEQFNDRVDEFIKEQRQFNQRIENSIGELKGNTARYVVAAHFGEIPELLGLEFQDSLSRQQLRQLIGPVGRNISSAGDWQSFIRADLVLITTNPEGETYYIAVEASYTADKRDTTRARRNAELLNSLTGYPCHAVIASVHNVHEIEAELQGPDTYWYQLDPADFTPE